MDGYRLQLFSDVSERDGFGVELVDDHGERVAEVFKDDDRNVVEARTLLPRGAPVDALRWLLDAADKEF